MSAYAVIANRVNERSINVSELSRRVNIDYELLRRSLKGTRKLQADELVSLCKELDLEVSDFTESPA